MTKFYQYLNNNDDIIPLIEVYYFIESNVINESVEDWLKKVQVFLNKMGIKKGQKRGLIEYLKDSSMVLAKIIWYGFKASTGDEEAELKMREFIYDNKIDKKEIMNFIMKVDAITLGIISSPIRMIDAITGWNLMDALVLTQEDITKKAENAIKSLEDIAKTVTGKIKKTIFGMINKLKELLAL